MGNGVLLLAVSVLMYMLNVYAPFLPQDKNDHRSVAHKGNIFVSPLAENCACAIRIILCMCVCVCCEHNNITWDISGSRLRRLPLCYVCNNRQRPADGGRCIQTVTADTERRYFKFLNFFFRFQKLLFIYIFSNIFDWKYLM